MCRSSWLGRLVFAVQQCCTVLHELVLYFGFFFAEICFLYSSAVLCSCASYTHRVPFNTAQYLYGGSVLYHYVQQYSTVPIVKMVKHTQTIVPSVTAVLYTGYIQKSDDPFWILDRFDLAGGCIRTGPVRTGEGGQDPGYACRHPVFRPFGPRRPCSMRPQLLQTSRISFRGFKAGETWTKNFVKLKGTA